MCPLGVVGKMLPSLLSLSLSPLSRDTSAFSGDLQFRSSARRARMNILQERKVPKH